MKFKSIALRASFITLTAILAVFINPAFALLALVSASPATLCTSYDQANVSTTANYVTLSSSAKEEAWVKYVAMSAMNNTVFADSMIGGEGSGKPIIDYTDSGRIDGTTIHISVLANLGGPGVQGEGARLGKEEKAKPYDFSLATGFWWFGLGQTRVAAAQTIVGSKIDSQQADLLANRVAKKVNDDIEMVLVVAGSSARNLQFPNGKAYATLKSADTISLSLITKGGTRLSSLGGKPIKLSKGKSGASIEKFLFFGTHENLNPLNLDSAYLLALQNAQPRDDSNPIFSGDYQSVAGHVIYRDYVRQHDGYGSVGCALQPDAFLGIAVVADNTFNAGVLTGGGSATAAAVTPAPNYFEFWQLFAYPKSDGTTITTGVTTAYGAIIDATTGKTAFFSYTGNTGATLTGCIRLASTTANNYAQTVGGVTYSTAAYDSTTNPWTTATANNLGPLGADIALASGSYMVQTNRLGVPVGYTLGLAQRALCFGWGKGDAGNIDGKRRVDVYNNGLDFVWGVDIRYGMRAFLRTDGVAPGIVLLCHARAVDGLPIVT